MKVLFIVNTEDLGFEEPLGILYLSAVCKNSGHEVYAVKNNLPAIEKKLKSIKPDLIAVGVSTPSFPYLFHTLSEVRSRYDIPTVFGGPHATFFPEMIESPGVDAVCLGEGEAAFGDFLDLLGSGNDSTSVENFWIKKNGRR